MRDNDHHQKPKQKIEAATSIITSVEERVDLIELTPDFVEVDVVDALAEVEEAEVVGAAVAEEDAADVVEVIIPEVLCTFFENKISKFSDSARGERGEGDEDVRQQ